MVCVGGRKLLCLAINKLGIIRLLLRNMRLRPIRNCILLIRRNGNVRSKWMIRPNDINVVGYFWDFVLYGNQTSFLVFFIGVIVGL